MLTLTDAFVIAIVAAIAGGILTSAYTNRNALHDDERDDYRRAIEYWRQHATELNQAHGQLQTVVAKLSERNARLQREVDALRVGYMERTQQALMRNLERYVTHN